MANALGIAAVTAVLKNLLDNGLIDAQLLEQQDVAVTALPPDQVAVAEQSAGASGQLNLFLYQVMPNTGWCNAQYPSHDSQGQRITNPPLALDLHYMLTAYGKEEFDAEILLGYAMQLLHEHPVFNQTDIRRTFSSNVLENNTLPSRLQSLSAAALAEQVESIKVTPKHLDTEEMSRIWSSLQASYRTSTAYQVSVVLIESQRSTKAAMPVQQSNIFVTPLQSPFIDEVTPQLVGVGKTLTLKGHNLRGQTTQVTFGNAQVPPIDLPMAGRVFRSEEIAINVPTGLRAGTNTLQVIHQFDLGTQTIAPNSPTSEPHRGVESNVAAFVVQPQVSSQGTGAQIRYDIEPLGDTNALIARVGSLESGAVGYRLTQAIEAPALWVRLNVSVWRNQQIVLLLNQMPGQSGAMPNAYSISQVALLLSSAGDLALPVEQQNSSELLFPIGNVPSGNYLVRVRVDGADSPLLAATDGANRRFVAPQVSL